MAAWSPLVLQGEDSKFSQKNQKKMGAQADELAMQEALALSLAFKAVGLPIE